MPDTLLTGRWRLSATQDREFDRHAARLGHDPGRLAGETELISYPGVPSVAAMRALTAATAGQRRGASRSSSPRSSRPAAGSGRGSTTG
jgi:hypothetical protein